MPDDYAGHFRSQAGSRDTSQIVPALLSQRYFPTLSIPLLQTLLLLFYTVTLTLVALPYQDRMPLARVPVTQVASRLLRYFVFLSLEARLSSDFF